MRKSLHQSIKLCRLALLTSLALAALQAQASNANTFRIKSLGTNLLVDVDSAMTANGTQIHQYPQNGGTNQHWIFQLADDTKGDYRIKSALPGGGVLDVKSVTNNGNTQNLVVENADTGAASQRWQRRHPAGTAPGVYELVNRQTGQCLDVPGWSTAPSVQLIVFNCTQQSNQRWLISNLDNVALPEPSILKSFSSGKVADANQAETTNIVKQWAQHNGGNQQWLLIPSAADKNAVRIVNVIQDRAVRVADSANGTLTFQAATSDNDDYQLWEQLIPSGDKTYIQLRNKKSRKCLDVSAFSTIDGTQLNQYDCKANGNLSNQGWNISAPGAVQVSSTANLPSTATAAPPTTPVATTPVATTPPGIGKRGIGGWWHLSQQGMDKMFSEGKFNWYYEWQPRPSPVSKNLMGAEFVPMIWGKRDFNDAALNDAKNSASPYLLGMNEPDVYGQNNYLSVNEALDFWPKLMATGKLLVAPAVAGSEQWRNDFMDGIKSRGLRVDAIAVHFYTNSFDVNGEVDNLRKLLESVHNRHNKDIWVTEFAMQNYQTDYLFPADLNVQLEFNCKATALLNTLPYVKRYAWFAAFNTQPNDNAFTNNDDGSMTKTGQMYSHADQRVPGDCDKYFNGQQTDVSK